MRDTFAQEFCMASALVGCYECTKCAAPMSQSRADCLDLCAYGDCEKGPSRDNHIRRAVPCINANLPHSKKAHVGCNGAKRPRCIHSATAPLSLP